MKDKDVVWGFCDYFFSWALMKFSSVWYSMFEWAFSYVKMFSYLTQQMSLSFPTCFKLIKCSYYCIRNEKKKLSDDNHKNLHYPLAAPTSRFNDFCWIYLRQCCWLKCCSQHYWNVTYCICFRFLFTQYFLIALYTAQCCKTIALINQ